MNFAPRWPSRRELGLQQVHTHPVVVHRHAADLGLVRRERLQGADVGRALGDDDVAGIEERLAEQIERLLSAGGDRDVVGRASRTPISAISSTTSARICGPTLARAVLQRA
jgi:hypothetical protein